MAWSHPPSDSMVETASHASWVILFQDLSFLWLLLLIDVSNLNLLFAKTSWIYCVPMQHTRFVKQFCQQLIMKAVLKAISDLNRGKSLLLVQLGTSTNVKQNINCTSAGFNVTILHLPRIVQSSNQNQLDPISYIDKLKSFNAATSATSCKIKPAEFILRE